MALRTNIKILTALSSFSLACSSPSLQLGSAATSGGAAAAGAQVGNAGIGGTANAGGASGATSSGGQGGSATPPSVSGPLTIATNSAGGCALRAGYVWCWGVNTPSQLGQPSSTLAPLGVWAQGLSDIVEVQSADDHACARRSDGKIFCWGLNVEGQLGTPNAAPFTCKLIPLDAPIVDQPCQPTPTLVPSIDGALSLAVTEAATCAVLGDSTVQCWGRTGNIDAWARSLSNVRKLRIGSSELGEANACAIDAAGNVSCSDPSIAADGARDVSDVALSQASASFGCILDAAGRVKCWGDNSAGELGVGALNPAASAGLAAPAITAGATAVSVGYDSACALMADGSVECWGYTGSTTDARCGDVFCQTTPTLVTGLPVARTLSVGCVATTSAEVWCWPFVRGPLTTGANGGVTHGGWEDTGSSCDQAARAIDVRMQQAYDSVQRNCLTKYDCVDVPLVAGCYAACSSGAVSKQDASMLQAALASASATLCDGSLGCANSTGCPAAANDLDCFAGYCVHFDPVATGCDNACDCQATSSFTDSVGCAGVDLEFYGFSECSLCGGANDHLMIYNRGQTDFHGSVTLTASTIAGEPPSRVPSPVSAVIDVPAGGTNTSMAMTFDDAPGEVRVTLSADADCDSSNNDYIVDVPQFGSCP